MNQPPPLTPQEIARLSVSQHVHLGQPQAVKVFGILHVVFAAFGLLGSAWQMYVAIFGNPMYAFTTSSPTTRLQIDMENQLMPTSVASAVITIIIASVMLFAGIQLLRGLRNGLLWSNRYAWTSLVGKAIGIIITIFFIIPVMKESLGALSGSTTLAGMTFGGMMYFSMTIGILVSCIYPILTLVLLNRPVVKNWFSNQPI
jgi:hypothetical protein